MSATLKIKEQASGESDGRVTGAPIIISMVSDAFSTSTRTVDVLAILQAIKQGRWREEVARIRCRYNETLKRTGSHEKAKKAVEHLKKNLPGVIWSGTFRDREQPVKDKLIEYSGLFCADTDVDALAGKDRNEVRAELRASLHVLAYFLSPTGHGLKVIVRVRADALRHEGNFLAVQQHVLRLTGVQIDESGKDLGRLCFVSYDPDAYLNLNAQEIAPLPEAEKPKALTNGVINLSERQRIVAELLGNVEWVSETSGYVPCPGKHLHTTGDGERDCEIHLNGVPTVHCFHNHCRGILEGINHELRSRIGKAEYSNTAAGNASHEEKSPIRKSAATRLVEFANAFDFFHDPQDRPFVRLEINGHLEVWPVESSKFRKLLARIYYQRTHKAVNRNALADAITTLAGRACHDSPEEKVFLRVAPHGENILIDLCDPQWRVIEVMPSGWQVLDKSPVAFVRTGSMQALPEPVHSGSIAPLWEILNVTEAQRPLVAAALLNYFHPEGPYFVLNFVGEQGTAKSCAARIVRQLVDPNENPLRSPPKEERDLIAQAASNRCVALDNLSSLPAWLSDALCRLATGGGHSARTLYTDLEEISLAVKRPVILNGIEDVARRPDLAERVLQVELETIPAWKRISEKELWRQFNEQWPTIFSGLVDALVCALRELPSTTLDSLPRMADATIWATAGETAFGWERGTFIKAYKQNLDEGAVASVEAHPVGVAIRKLLEKQEEWEGEPAKLLEAIAALVSEEQRRAMNWLQNARSLSACLRRLAPALRRSGISYETSKGQRRSIRMCKVGNFASQPSFASGVEGDIGDAKDAKDANFSTLHVSDKEADKQVKPVIDEHGVGRV